jgi:uncharacterized protein (DUF58 family)
VIPVRALPPQALLIALTPLLDDRMVDALVNVRGRGADAVVVEISPEPFVKAGRSDVDRLAHRIWLLRRAAVRARFRQLGVPIVEWRAGEPLEPALEEVTSFRRFARSMRA